MNDEKNAPINPNGNFNNNNQNNNLENNGQANVNLEINTSINENQVIHSQVQNGSTTVPSQVGNALSMNSSTISTNGQVTSSTSNSNDFSGVIDPSQITVGPEAINPQIPVNNPSFENQPVNNTDQNSKEPKKNNTLSLFFVFLLFALVGAFIWFMPEIHDELNKQKENKNQSQVIHEEEQQNQEQTNSYESMICSQISNTYTIYSQEDKIKKYSLATVYTSDIDTNYQSCLTLQQSEVSGFIVGCDKTANSVTVVKTYDFVRLPSTFNQDTLDFKQDDSIKSIKTRLEQKGYTCS